MRRFPQGVQTPSFAAHRIGTRCAAMALCVLTAVGPGCDRGRRDDDDKPKNAEGGATRPAGAESGEVKLTPEAIAHHGIKIEKAGRHVLVPTFTVPARIAYDQEAMAQVGSAVPGRVAGLKARLGDVVKKGDELLTVESTELGAAQSDYLQKRTAVAAATAAVEPVRAAYERGKQLYEQGQQLALAEVQRREAEYRATQTALESTRAAASAAENKLQLLGLDKAAVERLATSGALNPMYVVRAPIGGTVISREVTLGQLVAPDKDVLLILADVSTLWVIAEVPEARAAEVAAGSKARVTVAALPKGAFDGTVSYVASDLNEGTRTIPVRIEVENADGALKAGMFARVEVSAGARGEGEPVLAVPEEAVVIVGGRTVVFVPDDEENTFKPQPVTVGRAVGGRVPVLSGLKEQAELVTAGTFVLKAELAKSQVEDND